MVGPIAQQITLVSYGNAFLRYRHSYPKLDSDNSTFQFCNSVRFIERKKRILSAKYEESLIAAKALEWFAWLKQTGCRALRICHDNMPQESIAPNYKLAGLVGGGGIWMIEAVYDTKSSYWIDSWKVTRENDTSSKIWSVIYSKVVPDKRFSTGEYDDVTESRANLENSLKEILLFADNHDLFPWTDIFKKSLEILDSEEPNKQYYHTDLIVSKNYELSAQQSLFAAGKAWVFGGMGSWNDLGFDDKNENDKYEELSSHLFEAICKAIVTATNSSKIRRVTTYYGPSISHR